MQELRIIKTKKRKGSILLKLALICFVAFFVAVLARQQVQISQKQGELENIQGELHVQQILNEELIVSLENGNGIEDYAEKSARRDFGYAKPGERVFVDVTGD